MILHIHMNVFGFGYIPKTSFYPHVSMGQKRVPKKWKVQTKNNATKEAEQDQNVIHSWVLEIELNWKQSFSKIWYILYT